MSNSKVTSRPNILVLMSDQHSKRQLGCYGDSLVRTPNLDRLASEGMLFENAYCPSPVCVCNRIKLSEDHERITGESTHCQPKRDGLFAGDSSRILTLTETSPKVTNIPRTKEGHVALESAATSEAYAR